MPKILVSFSKNWADEFDMNGFSVFEKKDFDKLMSDINDYFDNGDIGPHEIEEYFGTNECLTWTSMEEVLSCFDFTNISDDEAAVFEKYKHFMPCFFPEFEDVPLGE